MAAAAYSAQPEVCVKDNFNNAELRRRISVDCDLVKGDECVAFTAVSHSDKAIIISFRGSTLNEVVVEVLEALFDAPVTPFVGGGNVLLYFNNAFDLLWKSGVKDDFLTLKNANPGYELWVTGHSLGAALASIAASTIAHTKLFPADSIKLVTYGQPRVGDKGYAAAVDSLLAYSYRVVHANDIVAQLPPQFIKGYHHHKSEVWYDNNMAAGTTFVECDLDEGKTCSDGQLDLNVADHLFYFNVAANFAIIDECKGWNPYRNGTFFKKS